MNTLIYKRVVKKGNSLNSAKCYRVPGNTKVQKADARMVQEGTDPSAARAVEPQSPLVLQWSKYIP